MRFEVVTIFPGMFRILTEFGVVGRAVADGKVSINTWDPRDYALDKYRSVDDRPYGGGPGMVMAAPPLAAALDAVRAAVPGAPVLHLSPQGKRLEFAALKELVELPTMILLAGRYEGVDERILEEYVDQEWSIGDYVLSGGELPAMVLMDSIIRLLPGVLGNEGSADADSFAAGLLDFEHYTRPEEFRGRRVPEVLLGGDHAAIRRWRLKQSLGRTWLRRPDLLNELQLDKEQLELLSEFKREYEAGEGL
jgi:tRNA (guanine37-N1)-methyltransferase